MLENPPQISGEGLGQMTLNVLWEKGAGEVGLKGEEAKAQVTNSFEATISEPLI